MTADPLHEIIVLLALLAGYSVLAAAAWIIFCGGNTAAARRLNAAVASRNGPVFSIGAGGEAYPDLDATLTALVAEKRLPARLASVLRRIAPVFHEGRWVVYPSNAYWAHRFKRLHSR